MPYKDPTRRKPDQKQMGLIDERIARQREANDLKKIRLLKKLGVNLNALKKR